MIARERVLALATFVLDSGLDAAKRQLVSEAKSGNQTSRLLLNVIGLSLQGKRTSTADLRETLTLEEAAGVVGQAIDCRSTHPTADGLVESLLLNNMPVETAIRHLGESYYVAD